MKDEKFLELIDYAIKREEGAAKFYNRLQGMAKNEASVELLKHLEEMELDHAKILREFTKEDSTSGYVPPKVNNLNLSELMVSNPPNEHMTYQDVLVVAMQNEEISKKLYEAMANKSDDEKTRNLFLRLAHEESKHKLEIETIYDEEILTEN